MNIMPCVHPLSTCIEHYLSSKWLDCALLQALAIPLISSPFSMLCRSRSCIKAGGNSHAHRVLALGFSQPPHNHALLRKLVNDSLQHQTYSIAIVDLLQGPILHPSSDQVCIIALPQSTLFLIANSRSVVAALHALRGLHPVIMVCAVTGRSRGCQEPV